MKRYKLFTLIGIALIIVIAIIRSFSSSEEIKIYTESVKLRSITEIVSASGKIQPETEIKISSDVSGEITELFVKEGQRVKKGTLLCRIKPDNYESMLQRAQASLKSTQAGLKSSNALLDQAKAGFETARLNFERQRKLFDLKLISNQEYELALNQYLSAEANMKSVESNVMSASYGIEGNEATLKEARSNLEKTYIYAPTDATVSKLNIEKGERVVGVSGMAGTELLRLANLNEMEVSIEINEIDVVKLHLQDSAMVNVEAYPNETFKGIVTEIANSSQNTNSLEQVTNFVVKVRLIQESYKHLMDHSESSPFRPGMSANVTIMTRHKNNCLSLPIAAVVSKDQSESQNDTLKIEKNKSPLLHVYCVTGNKVTLKSVKTGIQDAQYIEILSGLKVGEVIAAGPFDALNELLKPDSEIEIVDKETFFNSAQQP